LALAVCCFVSGCEKPDIALLLEGYLYEKPVILLFAPTTQTPELVEQRQAVSELSALKTAVFEVVSHESVHLNDEQKAQLGTPAFYEYFGLNEADFTVIIIAKSGEELLRKHKPVSASAIRALLDTP